jgi:hypothetical protein
VPLKGDGPEEAQRVPLKGDGLPEEAQRVPLKGDGLPEEAQRVPLKEDGLPEEAHEASYFAAPARIRSLSSKSIKQLYTSIVVLSRAAVPAQYKMTGAEEPEYINRHAGRPRQPVTVLPAVILNSDLPIANTGPFFIPDKRVYY